MCCSEVFPPNPPTTTTTKLKCLVRVYQLLQSKHEHCARIQLMTNDNFIIAKLQKVILYGDMVKPLSSSSIQFKQF